MNVILYSTGCPRCIVLKEKLLSKNIPYTEVTSKEEMIASGFDEVPVLAVDEDIMNFRDAVNWVNNYKES